MKKYKRRGFPAPHADFTISANKEFQVGLHSGRKLLHNHTFLPLFLWHSMYLKYRQTICVHKKNTFHNHCQCQFQLYEDFSMKKMHLPFVIFVQIMIVHVIFVNLRPTRALNCKHAMIIVSNKEKAIRRLKTR